MQDSQLSSKNYQILYILDIANRKGTFYNKNRSRNFTKGDFVL